MHRRVLLIFSAFVYFSLATFALVLFDAGLLVTSLVFFGIPAYALARFSAAPGEVLIAVSVFAAGMAILLEGIAHIYGVWYTLGVDELRIFNLIPLEVIVTSILQTLFLVLLYELMFDDGEYSTDKSHTRFISFGVFLVGASLLVWLSQYVLDGYYLSYSYIWIVGILGASSLATLSVTRVLSLRFFDRFVAYTCFTSVPLFLSLIVALQNTQKIFAFANEYLYSFSVFGEMVPLEEVALVLVMPLFVATIYELYLDDRR